MWIVGSLGSIGLFFEASCVSGPVLGSGGTEVNATLSPWASRENGCSAVGQEASSPGKWEDSEPLLLILSPAGCLGCVT